MKNKYATPPHTLKKLALGFVLTCAMLMCGIAAQAQWVWSTCTTGGYVGASAVVATDPYGNVYVSGTFWSPSITFGTTTLNNPGTYDMYIVKYDHAGNVLWARNADTTMVGGIAVDGVGNLYVTGKFGGHFATFGAITLRNNGHINMFTAKYDSSGNVLWAKAGGGTTNDYGETVAIDGAGNIVVAGSFRSHTIAIDTAILNNAGPGGSDICLLKYDTLGNLIWATSFGGTGDDAPVAIKADGTGSIYFTGTYATPLPFGADTLMPATIGVFNVFVAKCDSWGRAVWGRSAGGTQDAFSQSLAIDAASNIYVAGEFTCPSITFGTITLINAGPATSNDFFLTKYDSTGAVLWAKRGGGIEYEEILSVTTDAVGNVYVTGEYEGASIVMGTTTLINVDTTPWTGDIFVAKYDPAGNVVWAQSEGSAGYDAATGIAVDGGGSIYIIGTFTDTIAFGTMPTMIPLIVGWQDMFVAKLSATTGVREVAAKKMALYPNPASNTITISSASAIGELIITNAMGQTVNSVKTTTDKVSIDVANLPTGIYIIKASNGSYGSFSKY